MLSINLLCLASNAFCENENASKSETITALQQQSTTSSHRHYSEDDLKALSTEVHTTDLIPAEGQHHHGHGHHHHKHGHHHKTGGHHHKGGEHGKQGHHGHHNHGILFICYQRNE